MAVGPGLRSSDSYGEAAALRHGVDCVGDLIGEDLSQLAFESPDLEFVAKLFYDGEALRFELAAVEDEEVIDQGGELDETRCCGFSVEAEGLFGDLRNSRELFVRHLQILRSL